VFYKRCDDSTQQPANPLLCALQNVPVLDTYPVPKRLLHRLGLNALEEVHVSCSASVTR
jgi:hypothetical protein